MMPPPADAFDQYQEHAWRTAARAQDPAFRMAILALGLVGEAGEVSEHIKKYAGHGHALDAQKLKAELGDVLWYAAVLATEAGLSLSEVAQANVKKLQARYPEGFTTAASLVRQDVSGEVSR